MANPQNIKRARRNVIDYVNTNMTEHTKMITLTYAENMTDYDRLNRDWKAFLLALKRRGFSFPWLVVMERQERGAYHAHLIAFTDIFIPKDILAKAWKHGMTNVEELRAKDNAGAYVAKYLTKQKMPAEKNAYRRSRGLKKPNIAKMLGGGEDVADYLSGQGYECRELYYGSHYIIKDANGQEINEAMVRRFRKPRRKKKGRKLK